MPPLKPPWVVVNHPPELREARKATPYMAASLSHPSHKCRYTIIRLVRMRMPVGTALEQSVMEGHVLFLLQCECFAVGAMSAKPCAPTGERGARTSCSMNGQRKAST
nr:PREDICTED: uncharacterized protein LOC108952170 isoform X2 [Musa acuminata subsp. malaccensis]